MPYIGADSNGLEFYSGAGSVIASIRSLDSILKCSTGLSSDMHKLSTTAMNATNTTTYADIPGMSVNLQAATNYYFEAWGYIAANAAAGVKVGTAGTLGIASARFGAILDLGTLGGGFNTEALATLCCEHPAPLVSFMPTVTSRPAPQAHLNCRWRKTPRTQARPLLPGAICACHPSFNRRI